MVDFERIKSKVTIEDILTDCGYETKKGRMACPIHNGQNHTSFSFSDHSYHCYSCGASGGLLDLAQVLLKTSREGALEYLTEKAGMPSHHSAQKVLASRHRSPRPQPFREDIQLADLQFVLQGLDLLRDYFTSQIRRDRERFKKEQVDPFAYYAAVQYAEYILEELDAEVARIRYGISVERKKLRENRKT